MILCSGCFDGLHAGHVAYLCAADSLREAGEVLAVAIAPDSYVRQAKHRDPWWDQASRIAVVSALKMVDVVLPQTEDSPAAEIHSRRPRLFVKGSEWSNRLPPDVRQACEAVGCTIMFTMTPGRHSSDVRGQPIGR